MPFDVEEDVYTVRDAVTDEILYVCRRCYETIVRSEEGFTKHEGVREVIEEEVARLKDLVSRRVEEEFYDLIERYQPPLGEYVYWFTDADGNLVIEVKGENGCRGVRLVIDREAGYSEACRVEASDWCTICSIKDREMFRMRKAYREVVLELLSLLSDEDREKVLNGEHGMTVRAILDGEF